MMYWYEYGFNFIIASTIAILTMFLPGLCTLRLKCNLKHFIFLQGSVFLMVTFALYSLIYSFIISDFSICNVVNNSHSNQPLIYKVASTWGNHEGSMMLWVWIINAVSFLYGLSLREYSNYLHNSIIKLISAISVFFNIFLLNTSNPYIKTSLIFEEGTELSPILQDLLLVIHPPIIYIGYISLAIPFIISLYIIMKINTLRGYTYVYVKKGLILFYNDIKYWTLISFIFLTLGITLGSWWAYFELGWGGWWFWDPVENASLMPWIATVILLHQLASKSTDKLLSLIYVCMLPFIMSIIGTFMVRSGFLESVHSFAEDTNRGVWLVFYILAIILAIFYYSFTGSLRHLWTNRISIYYQVDLIRLQFFLSLSVLAIIAIGTFYPTIHKYIYKEGVTVGFNFFHNMINPIVWITIFLFGIYFLYRSPWSARKYWFLMLSYITCVILQFIFGSVTISSLLLNCTLLTIILAIFIIVIECLRTQKRIKLSDIIHLGFLIFLLGVCIYVEFKVEFTIIAQLGEILTLPFYNIYILDHNYGENSNYTSSIINALIVQKKDIISSFAEKRYYFSQDFYSSKPYVLSNILEDIYLILGDGDYKEGWEYKIHINPGMSMIWFSSGMILISSILKLISMRLKK